MRLNKQINLALPLPLDYRKSNLQIKGNNLIVTSIESFLEKLTERELLVDYIIYSPEGSYDISNFKDDIENKRIIPKIYRFDTNFKNVNFKEVTLKGIEPEVLESFENRLDSLEHFNENNIELLLNDKVDKVVGKQLSDENFTIEEKNKLNSVEVGANNYVLPSDVVKDSNYNHTDNNYTDADKNKLQSLENYDDTGIINSLSDKVDKIVGKGLSTEDFTTEEKLKLAGLESAEMTPSEIKVVYESNPDTNAFTDSEKSKLSGIESGAQKNVQIDWNALSGITSIKNKPTLGSLSAKNKIDISDINTTGTPSADVALHGDGTWKSIGAGSANWGSIGGDISLQTDLINALAGKVDSDDVKTSVPAGAVFTDTIYDDTTIKTDIAKKVDKSDLTVLTEEEINLMLKRIGELDPSSPEAITTKDIIVDGKLIEVAPFSHLELVDGRIINFNLDNTPVSAFDWPDKLLEIDRTINNITFYSEDVARVTFGRDYLSVKTLPSFFLAGTTHLEYVDLNGLCNVEDIGDDFLSGFLNDVPKPMSTHLKSVKLPFFNLKSFGPQFLRYRAGLTEVDMTNVKSISLITKNLFYDNMSLKRIIFGNLTDVIKVEGNFCIGTGLEAFNLYSLKNVKTIEGHFLASTQIKYLDMSMLTELESVRNSLGNGCTELLEVKFPPQKISIDSSGFMYNAQKLKQIDLSNFEGTTSILSSFLHNTYVLESVDLAPLTSVKTIDNHFLRNSRLITDLDMSMMTELEQVGNYFLSGMTALTTLKMGAITPPTLGSNAFVGANNLSLILVPCGSVDDYKSATNWIAKADIIQGDC